MYQQQSKPVAPKLNFSSIVTIVVVAIILMVCSTCFYTVDTGERGVVLRFGFDCENRRRRRQKLVVRAVSRPVSAR